jgi:hypothetical protein
VGGERGKAGGNVVHGLGRGKRERRERRKAEGGTGPGRGPRGVRRRKKGPREREGFGPTGLGSFLSLLSFFFSFFFPILN